MPRIRTIRPGAVVRSVLGVGTLVFLGLGLLVHPGAKLLTASGILGGIWWGWDLIVEYLLAPLGDWIGGLAAGGDLRYQPPGLTVDERIRLLDRHLTRAQSRRRQIQLAMRLAEVYRYQKRDPEQARRVIERIRLRYPDAPELRHFTTETKT